MKTAYSPIAYATIKGTEAKLALQKTQVYSFDYWHPLD